MNLGYLLPVLHAHLPFVRHPEYEDFLEEGWLHEAIIETYIPLLWALEGLVRDEVDFRLTLSLTPTLVAMLNDDLLRRRFANHLDRMCEFAEREVERTRYLPRFHETAMMYRDRFVRQRSDYHDRWRMDLVGAFVRLEKLGKVEIMASAATHAFLPLLRVHPAAVRAQVLAGVEHHTATIGRRPAGIWLPECGFYPGLDELLEEAGIRYFFLDAHGIHHAAGRTRYGVHAPLYCPAGPAAFGRDPESSGQVWSSLYGYPGDYDYREFYRDAGYDLDLEYIRPYIHKDGIRLDTGFKYYRITGPTERKEPYERRRALEKAAEHAGNFLFNRQRQAEWLHGWMGRKPVIVAPYDAELFGHWWFEGPDWIDLLFRKTAGEQDAIRLIQPLEYLEEYPTNQVEMPGASSWGHKGHNQVWLNGRNDWIYRHLHEAAARMTDMAERLPAEAGLRRRALDQGARELLLAQASDWAFIMSRETVVEYAVRRTRDHLARFTRLYEMVRSGSIDEEWLAEIERKDNFFSGLDYRIYRSDYRLGGSACRPEARFPGASRGTEPGKSR